MMQTRQSKLSLDRFVKSGYLSFFPLAAAALCACGSPSDASYESATIEPVAEQRDAVVDTSTPVATWYLSANGFRLEANITSAGSGFSGQIRDEGGAWQTIDSITWDSTNRWLEFRRVGPGFFQWYKLSMAQGVISGRFSHSGAGAKPALTAYTGSVTGWSPTFIDGGNIVPRTWEIAINANFKAVLRVDRNSSNVLEGRLKVYDNSTVAGAQEELEADLTSISWNGTNLSFVRSGPGFTQTYTGTASGRFISGTFTHNGGAPSSWSGARAQVLGFGLGSRLSQRTNWQEMTRDRLVNLTEGMRIINTAIPSISVTEVPCSGSCPTVGALYGLRDDNPNAWGTNYTVKRLRFQVSPGNRFDPANPPPVRQFYGFLSTPTVAPPAGGYRAMVVVNGHGGDARQVMSTDNLFWGGESAARRHLMVLALDIGHRDFAGPIQHPAVIGSNYSASDWEEDGERAFSVRRAIDYLTSLPNVRADRVFMSGLSMGGEVTTLVSALDPRIKMAIPAGYSPDYSVMDNHGNHDCYEWKRGSLYEYVDDSDYLALIAPRLLLVETGINDFTFSPLGFPGDKQVIRRARAAYGGDVAKIVHYLHAQAHEYQVGDINPSNGAHPRGVRATSKTGPAFAGDQSWQTDSTTFERSPTLYDLMNETLL